MSEVKRWYVDEWSDCREVNDGPFVKYADYTALAERLKSCEAILDEIKRQDNTSSLVAKYCELKSERDQLTADLANLNAMHQQLASVLHDDDMPTFAPVANVVEDVMQMRKDLQRARAEVEECAMAMRAMQNVSNNKTDKLKRLKAALVAIGNGDWQAMLKIVPDGIQHRACPYNDVESFNTEGSYEEDARYSYPAREKMVQVVAQAALKETP